MLDLKINKDKDQPLARGTTAHDPVVDCFTVTELLLSAVM